MPTPGEAPNAAYCTAHREEAKRQARKTYRERSRQDVVRTDQKTTVQEFRRKQMGQELDALLAEVAELCRTTPSEVVATWSKRRARLAELAKRVERTTRSLR